MGHFDSGYKLRGANQADQGGRFGNLRIDRAAFAEHKRDLEAVEEPDVDARRLELTRSCVAAHGAPRPGEALIVTREGARGVTRHDDQADEFGAPGSARYDKDFTKKVRDAPNGGERTALLDGGEAIQRGGSSHTTMVDTFAGDRLVILTVEGNSGQAVSAQRIDLTVPEQAEDGAEGVGRCIALPELDPARFHHGSALAGAAEPAGVSEETLAIARRLVDDDRNCGTECFG